MALPPEWLVEWTKFVSLVVTTILGVRALWHGGRILAFRANNLR